MSTRAHVIVLGNEKGGTGKSTVAVHLAVALADAGHSVRVLDLDQRQRTSFRYLENRARYAARHDLRLALPAAEVLPPGGDPAAVVAAGGADVLIFDTPGRDSAEGVAAMMLADLIITPINDSFVDLDLIGEVDPDSFKVTKAAFYAETVWKARAARAAADGASVDWVLLRNRLSTLEARNRRRVGDAMDELSRRVGFRVVPGLSERVIYRELFPKGLTLLDKGVFGEMSMGHVAARAELRTLMQALGLWGERAAA
jgi:chromosome partitioning protein